MSAPIPPRPASPDATPEEPIIALLQDLQELGDYLRQRSQQTFATAQKFADNARKHPDTRAYDERQVTMLEYQHHIWQEIAGLVDRLITRYTDTENN